ncbi:hypothetical protein UC35_05950 [Ramlibacter tataouinensis]|uniref:HTH crp-type domain-containing protein n=2 Tax=Ramlibacter tataouinensis TaxID=94132 RepID=A0A127JZ92_9BURK|nr:hypothetical protein UC35_05950 [Ramlibacter tataouinensis]
MCTATPSDAAVRMPCAICALGPLCMPEQSGESAPAVRLTRRKVRRGEVLFRRGQSFRAFFAPRTGYFKTFLSDEHGHAQVLDFQMAGDLLGLDGVVDGVHHCEAVALGDAEVCVVEFNDALELCSNAGGVAREFQRQLAQAVARHQRTALHLRAIPSADHRLARFLVDWTGRLRRLGLPGDELLLRMTREELGSLLGLTLETVSRALTRLKRLNVLNVSNRYIEILDVPELRKLAGT